MTRRVQSINPNDPQALRKVIEALEVSEGVRGNKEDRKPTIKEVRAMLGAGNSTYTSIASGGSSGSSSGGSFGGVSGGAVPSKPSGLSAKEFEDFIVLMWDWPLYQGHSGSEIYRSTTDSLASSERIGSTDGNYFVDWTAVSGQTYYYFICHKNAVSLGSRTSPFSESVAGKRVDPESPIKPSGLSAKEFEDFIVLMWDWPLYQGHSGSEIYRSTTNSLANSIVIGSTDSTYFIDWTAVAGQTYYYFIRHKNAVSLGGSTSPYANSVSGTIPLFPVVKPTNISIQEATDSLTVSWSKADYTGHAISELWRSETDSVESAIYIGATVSSSYTDSTADAGQTYYYFIRHKNAVSLGGSTSPFSESVAGKRVDPVVVIKPVAKAGIISSTGAIQVSLGNIDDGKTILISLGGMFTSQTGYDFALEEATPEIGNAVSVELKRGAVVLGNFVPEKIQTSHKAPYGQIIYTHNLSNAITEPSTAGTLTYTMEVTRLFPSNTDPFQISYSIQTL